MSETKVQRCTAVVVRDPYSREPKFFGRLAHCEDGEAVKFADYERDIAERDKTIANLRAEMDRGIAEARNEVLTDLVGIAGNDQQQMRVFGSRAGKRDAAAVLRWVENAIALLRVRWELDAKKGREG